MRALWTLGTLAGAFLLPLHLSSSDAQSRQPEIRLSTADIEPHLGAIWYAAYQDGQKVGFARKSLARFGDGENALYVEEFQLTLKTAVRGTPIETEDFRITRFDGKPPFSFNHFIQIVTNGRSRRQLEISRSPERGFDIVTIVDGKSSKEQVSSVDYTLTDLLAPGIWVRRKAKAGDQLTTKALGMEPVELRRLATTRTRTIAGVSCLCSDVEVNKTGRERYDDKGRLVYRVLPDNVELYLEPERQAKALSNSLSSRRDVSQEWRVDIDKPLGSPRQVKRLVIEVEGTGGDVLRSGPYQLVVRGEPGIFVCKVGKEYGELAKATPDEIRANLAETSIFPTKHAGVQRLLREALDKSADKPAGIGPTSRLAVGDARTTKETIKRLLRFVREYVDYVATPYDVSVPEIIATRKGDCSERARLFTTMARAAGIPAREVHGLVYTDDTQRAFDHHAWNEVVYDGVWVPVDAVCDDMEITATHIRLGVIGPKNNASDAFISGKTRFRLIEVERRK